MEGRVEIGVAGAVATVRMVRVDRHNALDAAMFKALHAAIDRLAGEPGIRVAVLTGDGPSFCSGLDIPSFMSPELETELQLGLIGSPNQLEALQAGAEKRDPHFTDPARPSDRRPDHNHG